MQWAGKPAHCFDCVEYPTERGHAHPPPARGRVRGVQARGSASRASRRSPAMPRPARNPMEMVMGAPTLELIAGFAERSQRATQQGARAFARLLKIAEHGESGQPRRVAQFVAATTTAGPIRLTCSSCGRWTSTSATTCRAAWTRCGGDGTDLYRLVPDGEQRVRDAIRRWGLGAVRD